MNKNTGFNNRTWLDYGMKLACIFEKNAYFLQKLYKTNQRTVINKGIQEDSLLKNKESYMNNYLGGQSRVVATSLPEDVTGCASKFLWRNNLEIPNGPCMYI